MSSPTLAEFKSWVFQTFENKFVENGYADLEEVADDLDLIDSGVLDSLELLDLLEQFYATFSIAIDLSDVEDEIFTSIAGLYDRIAVTPEADKGATPAEITRETFRAMLVDLGVGPGDTLLVHAALQRMGTVVDGVTGILAELQSLVGPQGTLLAPAANIQAFLDGGFDPVDTPVQLDLGSLPEAIRQPPDAVRSDNPFESVCGTGPRAADICGFPNRYCYGEHSPWRAVLHHDAKLLLLGSGFYYASIVHAGEVACNVPYRSWKQFAGEIGPAGKREQIEINLYARSRDLKCYYNRIADLDQVKANLKTSRTDYGEVSCIDLNGVYQAILDTLQTNPDYFL